MREAVIGRILEKKVIAIVRGVYGEDCLRLASALHAGGVELLEVTFDQKSESERLRTCDTIRLLNERLGERMCFGAGTVTSPEMVALAREAGAQFIVSPDTDGDVIRAARNAGMVSIPGALTPTEIATAHKLGADFVKVFPANQMGPAYFKAVSAPLSHIPMLAVGGVDGETVRDYLAAGAVGVGAAGCLFRKEWVKNGEWDRVTEAAKAFCAVVSAC